MPLLAPQISKYGHMAGDKVSSMTQDQVEGDLKGMVRECSCAVLVWCECAYFLHRT